MFVCYLDDSGGDSENPITALAGYVAMEAAWTLFERNVEPVFKEFSVEVLHAVNLHNTKGDFELWTRDRKEEFVSLVCEAMAPNVPLGISFSVDKENYEARRKESRAQGTDKQDTPYTYCFRAIIHWLIEQPEICAVGVSFVLECGHQNNRKARDDFQKMRQQGLEGILGTISFHAKQDSRAIQMADLFAYYSRRHIKWIEEHPHQNPERDPILDILPKGAFRVIKDVSDQLMDLKSS